MRGVVVSLYADVCGGKNALITSVTTRRDGEYSFENLPSGNYCVRTDVVPVCNTPSIPTLEEEYTIAITPGVMLVRDFGFAPYVC